MRFFHLALISALMFAPVAPAMADPPHGGEGGPEEKDAARSVELTGLVFPVFTETGRLKNYLFVDAKMVVADGKDPWKYRGEAHFIRDAVLRAAHRVSFNKKGDYNRLDEELAARECLKAANEILGEPGAMVTMKFSQIASQIEQAK